jgi:hypothetical protein
MTPGGAKVAVILGTGTAVVGTTMKEILDGKHGPSFYVPLAGALIAIPLLIMSDFQPDIAGSLGFLILAASFVYSGSAIMTVINNAVGVNSTNPASRTLQTPTSRTGA